MALLWKLNKESFNLMRILFLIGYFNKNNGGHFHSLHHISSEIATQHEVRIVSIGSPIETIINNNQNYSQHIDFNGKNLIQVVNTLNKIKNEFKPEIIHFFDKHIYVLYQKLVVKSQAKCIMHVCGGQNPKSFPFIDFLVLFSVENKMWFAAQKKFSETDIFLIPNRVHAIKLDLARQPIEKDGVFSFVRISRIGSYYQKSLLSSINLINKLSQDGFKTRLYIIGNVEEVVVLNNLKSSVLPNADVVFLTDKKYKDEASQMLYLADAVIATGRSAMEAMSLGLPVLTPLKNIKLPTLVTTKNFDDLFLTNFSERNFLEGKSEREVYTEVISLITIDALRKDLGLESKKHFEENFDVKKVIETYNKMYSIAKIKKSRRFLFRNIYFLFLSIYKFSTLYTKAKNV
jgi:glycosyltransferase involved in cell wall biosynthesis